MAMPSAEFARSTSVPADAPLPPALDPAARNAGADESWWQMVSAQMAEQEYAASPTNDGLQAPNRAQNLRTTFGDQGIEIVPRTGKDVAPAWRFAWETTGVGRPGRMKEVSPSTPLAAGARVVYQRDGWSEWYENTTKGLEQGFTIDRRPEGNGPLQIAGTFPEALRPEMREDGAVDFLDEHGACAIRYGELHVWDANGKEIDSRLSVDEDALAILVEDDGAAYPLTVDPLMMSPAWTAEANQAGAGFGGSVATAGDVNGDGFSDVIVGAPQYDSGQVNAGRAYVYHGSAAGLAISPAWTVGSNQNGANFGSSVATAGDVNGDGFSDVIVSAPIYANGEGFEGRAFVYHGSVAGLATTPAWTAESNQADAQFGSSVSTAGDVNGDGFSDVIVGAINYSNGQSFEGRAFVYHGSVTGLVTTFAWTAESNQTDSRFGGTVSTAGDVNGDGFADVIVGAHSYDNNEVNEGRVFVYHGSAAGLATAAARIVESNQISANFGSSVATAGDVNGDGFSDVIVGAPSYDNTPNDEGRAFVYQGSTTGLATTPAWTAESNQFDSNFGGSVATAGDVNGDGFSDVIVGAYSYDNNEVNEGRAYAYFGSAAGLAANAPWRVESDQPNAFIGISVATAGDVNGDGFSDVIVGASLYDNGETDEGRAFVYHGSGAGLATLAGWTAESDQVNAFFGVSVATAGDVNGDGFSDVIVGIFLYDNGETDEGRALVYHGSAAGIATTPAWTAESDQATAWFGISVATAGDVNGDGFSDVIVGAHSYDNGESDEGRAFVYHGSGAGLATTPAWTVESNQVGAWFGSVATAGDVNGDGFSDVIVGAYRYDNGELDEGRAFAYHGSAAGLAPAAAWSAESNQALAEFGLSVATAGDVNGDGFSDVIVGAHRYDNNLIDVGRAYIYYGSAAGIATGSAWTGESLVFGAHFGISVGTAGDVNGDGFSDVIIGAWTESFCGVDGRAHVYHGSEDGLPSYLSLHWSSCGVGGLGFSVGTAGDVNGDGFSDVIIGAIGYTNGEDGEGGALVFHGSAAGLAGPPWTGESNQASAQYGFSVATAGDVNGDGFSDVIVGAREYDNGASNEGRAFVYYGNQGDGLDRIPRQRRTDDSAPIWLLGNSDSDSAFRLKALGRTPAGRGRVRLQCEIKPSGIPFDGTGLVTGQTASTGTPGPNGSAVELSQLASGLTSETLYHWRLRILTDSPFFPRSQWLSLPYNASSEADLRTGGATTAVHEQAIPSADLWLAPPTPNPFNPRTTMAYVLPGRMQVRLAIHDVQGRLVRLLIDDVLPAGSHAIEWDGRDGRGQELATGIYLSRLEAGGEVRSRKLALVK